MSSMSELTHFTVDHDLSQFKESDYERDKVKPAGILPILGLAESCNIPLLSSTSRGSQLPHVLGGTSSISQTLLDRQSSLAFKCIRDTDRKTRQRALDLVANELRILGHRGLRGNPKFIELLGVGWDIPSMGDIWPVLVFEKAPHGDLGQFFRSCEFDTLDSASKLGICLDIGSAITALHSQSKYTASFHTETTVNPLIEIIHGDIKPDNFLVFGDIIKQPLVKIADFGYSVEYQTDEHVHRLPWSAPWHSPLVSQNRSLNFEEARSSDWFSYGMLSVWVIFGHLFSSLVDLPDHLMWIDAHVERQPSRESAVMGMAVLRKVNLMQQFVLDASQFACDLPTTQKDRFLTTLVAMLELRADVDFESLTDMPSTDADQILPPNPYVDTRRGLGLGEGFNLFLSWRSLYAHHYRIRAQVVTDLEAQPMNKGVAQQLYLCYKTGFGGAKKPPLEVERLLEYAPGYTLQEMQNIIDADVDMWWEGSRASQLSDAGVLDSAGNNRSYPSVDDLDKACRHLGQEVSDLKSSGLRSEREMLTLRDELATVYSFQKRENLALELRMQMLETSVRLFGNNHMVTAAINSRISLSYSSLGMYTQAADYATEALRLLKVHREDDHPLVARYKQSLGHIKEEQGLYDEADLLYSETFRQTEATFGKRHLSTVEASGYVIGLRLRQGRFLDAEELLNEYLPISREINGPGDQSTLDCCMELVDLYRSTGRFAAAEELVKDILDRATEKQGTHSPFTLRTMIALSEIYNRQERWSDAEAILQQALDTSLQAFGLKHPQTLKVMGLTIETKLALERREDLEKQARTCVELSTELLGPEHPQTLTHMGVLSSAMCKLHRYSEAQEIEEVIFEIAQRKFGDRAPQALISHSNLAYTYSMLGKFDVAERMERELLEKLKTLYGLQNPQTLAVMSNLVITLSSQRKYTEAEPLLEQGYELRHQLYGPEHPMTVRAMIDLAGLRVFQKRFEEAIESMTQVLGTYERTLGMNHIKTLEALARLALLHLKLKDFNQAQGKVDRIIAARQDIIDQQGFPPNVWSVLQQLVKVLTHEQKWTVAIGLGESLLVCAREVLGANDRETMSCMTSLASAYWGNEEHGKCEELEIDVVKLKCDILGPHHPDTLRSMLGLAKTWKMVGFDTRASQLLNLCKARTDDNALTTPEFATEVLELQQQWQEEANPLNTDPLD